MCSQCLWLWATLSRSSHPTLHFHDGIWRRINIPWCVVWKKNMRTHDRAEQTHQLILRRSPGTTVLASALSLGCWISHELVLIKCDWWGLIEIYGNLWGFIVNKFMVIPEDSNQVIDGIWMDMTSLNIRSGTWWNPIFAFKMVFYTVSLSLPWRKWTKWAPTTPPGLLARSGAGGGSP